ncbi:hypothetical protein LEP1GSC196_3596 [Leptospira meyeri serovar Semaranga str. Veldrot Semarang 173]|nr:hypothetical protein LEP1GSC196_3596 [Leptospira meyeri serovar Semaranga str. Veldrot Semarang 173]
MSNTLGMPKIQLFFRGMATKKKRKQEYKKSKLNQIHTRKKNMM